MSFLAEAFRILIILFRHPVVQAGLKHAVKGATQELIRQVNGSTRTKPRVTPHMS